MKHCTKAPYRHEREARAAARVIEHGRPSGWKTHAYRCTDGCVLPDGRRPWHWGHRRPHRGSRKRRR